MIDLPPPAQTVPAASSIAASARAVLYRALAVESNWVGIHAAEALIEVGESAQVRHSLLAHLDQTDHLPYRVGLWRVLARTAVSPEERAGWVAKIEQILLDPAASDQSAALECLVKLNHRLTGPALDITRRMAADPCEAETLVPLWGLALSGEKDALPRIRRSLTSNDPIARRRAGYVLRWLEVTDSAVLAELSRAADAEPPGTDIHAFLVSAALRLDADRARSAAWQRQLVEIVANGSATSRYEASQALAHRYPVANSSLLSALLEHPEGDVRIGAALIILAASHDH